MINLQEISALVNLLEDEDEEVWKAVNKKLLAFGPEIVPILEKAWETAINNSLQERLENTIQEIQFRSVCNDLHNWELATSDELLKGACIVARMQFPELKIDTLHNAIDKIKQDIWPESFENLTPLEQIKLINKVFFEIHKFSGNHSNYYAPQNYYLNQVLDTHKGNPVSLGIIYIELAKRLNLPIYGINLPKNFILGYKDISAQNKKESILFYINPFNKGAVLGKREIDFFLQQQKIEPDESFFYPCSNSDIIERLIRNLINSYESLNLPERVEKFRKLLECMGRSVY